MKRQATVERSTKETSIKAGVDIDGTGKADIATGIGFLDHMLEQLARHSLIDIELEAKGAFGRFSFREDVAVSEENRKTGKLVAMAMVKSVRQLASTLVVAA